jgi:hypothetical protein
LSNYTIKTVEKTISLNNEYETVKLFSKKSIEKHRQKYCFIHIGLVQVAVKPLTRQRLNTSVYYVYVMEDMLTFQDSLLGMVESCIFI